MSEKISAIEAQVILKEIEHKEIQLKLGVTSGCISNWKRRGIPRVVGLLLRKEYPSLQAWRLIDQTRKNSST